MLKIREASIVHPPVKSAILGNRQSGIVSMRHLSCTTCSLAALHRHEQKPQPIGSSWTKPTGSSSDGTSQVVTDFLERYRGGAFGEVGEKLKDCQ